MSSQRSFVKSLKEKRVKTEKIFPTQIYEGDPILIELRNKTQFWEMYSEKLE